MSRYYAPPEKAPTDDLQRTDWQDPESAPAVAGAYEAQTGGGHVFRRTWNGTTWLSSIDNAPSGLKMPWRGVVPGSVQINRYDSMTQRLLAALPMA